MPIMPAMLQPATDYAALAGGFRWAVPERFNVGTDVVDRHAALADRPALIFEDEAGRVQRMGFRALAAASNRFANAMAALGLRPGDRVGILRSQIPGRASKEKRAAKPGVVRRGKLERVRVRGS